MCQNLPLCCLFRYKMAVTLIVFFCLQAFVLFCCLAAGNDSGSQEVSDQEQMEYIKTWMKKKRKAWWLSFFIFNASPQRPCNASYRMQSHALFPPIIIRAAPAAGHPGHGRKSSSFQYNRQLESAHRRFRLPPVPSLSVPRYQRKTQGGAAHRPPGDSHASAGFPQRKSPALCE